MKPWGRTTCLYADDRREFHLADVLADGFSSRHYHQWKMNRITSLGATLLITQWRGDDVEYHAIRRGEFIDIPAGVVHKFCCLKAGRMWEHYAGSPCWPDDIVRLSQNGIIESNPGRGDFATPQGPSVALLSRG